MRKSITKLRAWLRLVRALVPDFKKRNLRLRKIVLTLSDMRDACVQLAAFRELCDPSDFPKIEKHLRERRHLARKNAAAVIRKAKATLEKELRSLEGLPAGKIACPLLDEGLENLRTQMNDARKTARLRGDTESLHAWRKCIKRFIHASPFVEGNRHGRQKALVQAAKLLGEEHDLALLDAELASHGGRESAKIRKLIRKRRTALLAKIFPSDVASRIEHRH